MKLPTQAKSVDRANRLEAAQAAGVNPAYWGPALKLLRKAGQGALANIMNS